MVHIKGGSPRVCRIVLASSTANFSAHASIRSSNPRRELIRFSPKAGHVISKCSSYPAVFRLRRARRGRGASRAPRSAIPLIMPA